MPFTPLQKELINAVNRNDLNKVEDLLKNPALKPNMVSFRVWPGAISYTLERERVQIDPPQMYQFSLASHAMGLGHLMIARLLNSHGVYLSSKELMILEHHEECYHNRLAMSL